MAIEALSDSIEIIGAILVNLSTYLSRLNQPVSQNFFHKYPDALFFVFFVLLGNYGSAEAYNSIAMPPRPEVTTEH